MSLVATTLSGAMTSSDTVLGVASASGISAPISTTGSGFTYLYVEAELMFVVAVTGTQVQVLRGQGGTLATAHAASAPLLVGLPSDFPNFRPAQASFVSLQPNNYQGVSAPVASATSITPSGPLFHVTGTTATDTIALPTGFVEGSITIIADGVWTWTAGGNILVAGTVTTAGGTVTFTYDAKTAKWYPSRLA